MSRSSNLIILGSLATLTTTLAACQTLLSAQLLVDTAYFLAVTVVLCATLPFIAGLIDSQTLRLFSLGVYTILPVGWALLLVYGSGVQLTLPLWYSLALCGILGGAICDRGAERLSLRQRKYAQEPVAKAFDSGRFNRTRLVATDSGAFTLP